MLKKKYHTKFEKTPKGIKKIVVKGDYTGTPVYDSLKPQIKHLKQVKKEKKAQKWAKRKKAIRKAQKSMKKLSENIDNANKWFLGEK